MVAALAVAAVRATNGRGSSSGPLGGSMDRAPTVWVAAAFIAVYSAGSLGRQARLFRSWVVVARASPLSPMLPHATSPQLLDAERQHGRSVGAGDRALSASSTPPRLAGEQCATPRERLPSGREAAAAWLLCVFIAALALGATSGLHNNEQPAATLANKTATPWRLRATCTPPLPCAEGATAIREPW